MARIGLVLGSGGLAGTAFHAGVITALWQECGWDARTAELLVGTSAGSISSVLLRAGLPPEDFLARMTGEQLSAAGAQILRSAPAALATPSRPSAPRPGWARLAPASPQALRRAARRPWTARPGAVVAAALPSGRIPSSDLQGGFEAILSGWPAEPLWLCALRLADGRRVVFGRDRVPGGGPSIGQAVAASCAVPGYYAPVPIDGQDYVDGGAHSLCNADLVLGRALDAVVVSAPMSTDSWLHRDREQPWRAAARAQLDRETRRIRGQGTPVLVVHPTAADRSVLVGGSMDGSRRPVIARSVLESVSRRLRGSDDDAVRVLRGS